MNDPVTQVLDRGPVGPYIFIWKRRKGSSVAPTVVNFMSFGQHLGIWREADRSASQPRHTSVLVHFVTNEKMTAELYIVPIDRPSFVEITLFHFFSTVS